LPRRRLTVAPGRGRDCWPASIRPTNGSHSAPRHRRHAEDIRCSSGTLNILDGRGWGVDGVMTVHGQDWTGLYSCRMLCATMDYLNTMLRTESNYSR